MSEPMLEMRSKFEGVAKEWINKCWPDSNKVEIDGQTWEPPGDAWPWHEVVEKTVPRERGTFSYPSGISWEIPDVSITLEPDFEISTVYAKTFVNHTGGELEVTEDWSEVRTVEDSQSIKFDERISFGSEITTKAGSTSKQSNSDSSRSQQRR